MQSFEVQIKSTVGRHTPFPQLWGKVSSGTGGINCILMRKNNLCSQVPLHPPIWTCLFSQALGRNRLTLNNRTISGKVFLEFSHGKIHPTTIWYLDPGHSHPLRHSITPIESSDNILLQLNTTLIFANKEEFSTGVADSVTLSKVAGDWAWKTLRKMEKSPYSWAAAQIEGQLVIKEIRQSQGIFYNL